MTQGGQDDIRELYVLDATREGPQGLFCFCPVELDEQGAPRGVVTGIALISTEPPEGSRYAGVFHPEGLRAAEVWAKKHLALHEDLKARFGGR